jgi:uroporphyrin-III C-methyltransferase
MKDPMTGITDHWLLNGLPTFEPGWVWLAGAGPGDPGLVTLHAANALAQADVIVYDALVDRRILDLARTGAVVEYAGKRGGKPSPRQRDISLRLVQLARDGKRVCRLKGGDPFVFIPGISAGIGGLAYAGIPVTHRDVNHAVTFLTGHDQSGLTPSSIDWQGVASGAPVIVMYMAIKHLKTIADELMAAGREADEPVAIISEATTEVQKVLETTLGEAAGAVEQSGLAPPALVVVGAVVKLRAALDWLGAINGRKLITDPLGTRAPADTDRSA